MIQRYIRTPIMHRAVEANGFVFFGGIIADDLTLDMAGQTKQVLDKLETYLAESGTDKKNIVSATAYVSDLGLKKGMNDVWTGWFAPENLPSRATLGVADLGENVLLELVVTAVKS
ncbi:RidA family protein [Halomonas sp. McH1-25]|uniref:RidA family protein n=1 Tax=unclassified Halomonas TaxID=2609666 RepID=UPI001EF40C7A|nr:MULTISPECIES: RidA family protein [unclassified Halomonas]MCG7601134.1 RidA family protein [Halomonas sp. McH1-25]MCP1344583.1 RidA family protein [Halomonas sp. FL8]MCP1362597.1 RidA family protein [Halomonas sp. BBD45]MCP1363977.1 RidA family protein [Halomonas sp. BBD48]